MDVFYGESGQVSDVDDQIGTEGEQTDDIGVTCTFVRWSITDVYVKRRHFVRRQDDIVME